MSKEDKIKRLKAEKVDLRDKIDQAQQTGNVSDVTKPVHNVVEILRKRIDRRTVKIQKLRDDIKNRQNPDGKPHIVLTRISPNKSARSTSIQGIVVHCTVSNNVEGSDSDLGGVASWFANPVAQVSAHVIVDSDGHSAYCVAEKDKAWHCYMLNSPMLGIENVGQVSDHWSEKEYDECARWVAKWSKEYGIPIQRGTTSGSTITKKGIFTHQQLGYSGGSHSDPGPNYDIDHLLQLAKKYS